MRIWVDADACPKLVKEILFRAAIRTKTELILVSNQLLPSPPSPFIKKMQVAAGFDVADLRIVEKMESGDLVITADLPLAAAVIDKGGTALNPRGELYSKNNVRERLSLRNFNTDLRNAGLINGGPPPMNKRQIQNFSNCLDQFLSCC